jgi:hypothetical protein
LTRNSYGFYNVLIVDPRLALPTFVRNKAHGSCLKDMDMKTEPSIIRTSTFLSKIELLIVTFYTMFPCCRYPRPRLLKVFMYIWRPRCWICNSRLCVNAKFYVNLTPNMPQTPSVKSLISARVSKSTGLLKTEI